MFLFKVVLNCTYMFLLAWNFACLANKYFWTCWVQLGANSPLYPTSLFQHSFHLHRSSGILSFPMLKRTLHHNPIQPKKKAAIDNPFSRFFSIKYYFLSSKSSLQVYLPITAVNRDFNSTKIKKNYSRWLYWILKSISCFCEFFHPNQCM